MAYRNKRRPEGLSTGLYTNPGSGKQKGSPAMLSVLIPTISGTCAIVAALVAAGVLAITWARYRPQWGALGQTAAAAAPVDVITITLRNTSVALAPHPSDCTPQVVIYRPEFSAAKQQATPFPATLRVLRAAA